MDYDQVKEIADRNGIIKVNHVCASGRHSIPPEYIKPVVDGNNIIITHELTLTCDDEYPSDGIFYDVCEFNDYKGDCCQIKLVEVEYEIIKKLMNNFIRDCKAFGMMLPDAHELLNKEWK